MARDRTPLSMLEPMQRCSGLCGNVIEIYANFTGKTLIYNTFLKIAQ